MRKETEAEDCCYSPVGRVRRRRDLIGGGLWNRETQSNLDYLWTVSFSLDYSAGPRAPAPIPLFTLCADLGHLFLASPPPPSSALSSRVFLRPPFHESQAQLTFQRAVNPKESTPGLG